MMTKEQLEEQLRVAQGGMTEALDRLEVIDRNGDRSNMRPFWEKQERVSGAKVLLLEQVLGIK